MSERRVVQAKSWQDVPNLAGLFLACVTWVSGRFIEDKEIVCGNCETSFKTSFKTTETKHVTCPACRVVNRR